MSSAPRFPSDASVVVSVDRMWYLEQSVVIVCWLTTAGAQKEEHESSGRRKRSAQLDIYRSCNMVFNRGGEFILHCRIFNLKTHLSYKNVWRDDSHALGLIGDMHSESLIHL